MLLQNKRFWKLESIFLLIAALLLCGCRHQKSPAFAASRHSEDDSIAAFFKDFYAGYDTLYHRYVAYDISTDERLHRARQLEFFLMEYCHDDIIDEYHSVEDLLEESCLLDSEMLTSMRVEKVAGERNMYTVNLQRDTIHIKTDYTLIRKDGKLKIYAIGRHPIMFGCDTQTIE